MAADSSATQTATESLSTDPKNNGARQSGITVSPSWIDLNQSTGNSNCSRALWSAYHRVFTAVFTLVTELAVFDTVFAVLLISVSSL